jgi:hypothetical protein
MRQRSNQHAWMLSFLTYPFKQPLVLMMVVPLELKIFFCQDFDQPLQDLEKATLAAGWEVWLWSRLLFFFFFLSIILLKIFENSKGCFLKVFLKKYVKIFFKFYF